MQAIYTIRHNVIDGDIAIIRVQSDENYIINIIINIYIIINILHYYKKFVINIEL